MSSEISVKERLLETASRLFYRQGYNLTGINQILAESGSAIGSLYRHYPSKVDLLMAYLEKANEIYCAALKAFIGKYRMPRNKLLGLFDFHVEFQVNEDFVGCNFMKINAEIARQEPKVEALVQAHKRNVRALVEGLVVQLDSKGTDGLSNGQLTDSIYLLLEGAMVDSTIHRDSGFIQRAKAIVNKLI
jgi:AcrR family transcriptional regulator